MPPDVLPLSSTRRELRGFTLGLGLVERCVAMVYSCRCLIFIRWEHPPLSPEVLAQRTLEVLLAGVLRVWVQLVHNLLDRRTMFDHRLDEFDHVLAQQLRT